jgi:hypothetical protein
MPDQEPRTGGVAVWLLRDGRFEGWYSDKWTGGMTPYLAFPLAEAEALQGKARDRDEWKASRELQKACADALRVRAESLIDPNDPAVRERLWASLYVIAASSYSDGIDSSSPTNAEMDEIVADVLDALRSKP